MVYCFGEMLIDCLPTGNVPGGAPMNVAIRLCQLGTKSAVISSVGNDDYGKQLLKLLKRYQVETEYVEVLSDLPTGTVSVKFNENKNATYTINQPVAWDSITLSQESIQEIKPIEVLIFGSLSLRSKTNETTLNQILEVANYKVFDVNFRAPFYDLRQVLKYMESCNLVKLNHEELQELADYLKFSSHNIVGQMLELNVLYPNCDFCITKGENGALLLYKGLLYQHNGFKVEVQDTVGAGDGFLAALLHELTTNENPQLALETACAMGALIASKKGATCEVSNEELAVLIQSAED